MREIARLRGFFVVLSFLWFAALPATAATWVVSSDADLVHQSDDAVLATTLASTVERDARGAIVTFSMRTRFSQLTVGSAGLVSAPSMKR